jgi:parallel beta-helix repeat protein
MPAKEGEKEAIWPQRATVFGNVCRKARLGQGIGIHITHASDVLVTKNLCVNNPLCGIQLNDSSHVRVLRNTCDVNKFGIAVYVDGCVEQADHNLIAGNERLDGSPVPVYRKTTDTCHR